MPMIAGAASPAPTAMQTLGAAGGGNGPNAAGVPSSPAGIPGSQPGGPPDITGEIDTLRAAADPLMKWFTTHPDLAAGGQALQSLLKQTLQQLIASSGVQTASSTSLPSAGQ